MSRAHGSTRHLWCGCICGAYKFTMEASLITSLTKWGLSQRYQICLEYIPIRTNMLCWHFWSGRPLVRAHRQKSQIYHRGIRDAGKFVARALFTKDCAHTNNYQKYCADILKFTAEACGLKRVLITDLLTIQLLYKIPAQCTHDKSARKEIQSQQVCPVRSLRAQSKLVESTLVPRRKFVWYLTAWSDSCILGVQYTNIELNGGNL